MLTDNWRLTSAQNGLKLISSDPGKSVDIHQDIPSFNPGDILKLSADMTCKNIVPGEKSWNRARLLLVQNDGSKNRWDRSHLVASFTGTHDWDSYHQFFTIGPHTEKIRVTAQLSHCTGSFRLKNLQLYLVTQTLVYTWVQRIILFSWAVFAVFLLTGCFGNGRSLLILKVLLVISFSGIVIGTTMPGKMRNHISHEISSQIRETGIGFASGFMPDPSKLGHFVLFTVFSVLLSRLMTDASLFDILFKILLLAGGTELAQIYIDGRTPLFTDFFIDMAGGGCGLLMAYLNDFCSLL